MVDGAHTLRRKRLKKKIAPHHKAPTHLHEHVNGNFYDSGRETTHAVLRLIDEIHHVGDSGWSEVLIGTTYSSSWGEPAVSLSGERAVERATGWPLEALAAS